MELQEVKVQAIKESPVKVLSKAQFLQQIEELRHEKITKLQLTGCNSEIPVELFTLREIRYLNLSDNGLKVIPSDITKLTFLTHLDISFNLITDLPPELASLKWLKILDWKKGKMRKIPDVVFTLTSLKKLNLADNRLTEVPDDIVNLYQLEELNIEKNLFNELNPKVADIKTLKLLIMHDMNCTVPPELLYLEDLSVSLPLESSKSIGFWCWQRVSEVGNPSSNTCKNAAIVLETIDKNSELDYPTKKIYIERLVNVARATHSLMYLYQYASDEGITLLFSSRVVQKRVEKFWYGTPASKDSFQKTSPIVDFFIPLYISFFGCCFRRVGCRKCLSTQIFAPFLRFSTHVAIFLLFLVLFSGFAVRYANVDNTSNLYNWHRYLRDHVDESQPVLFEDISSTPELYGWLRQFFTGISTTNDSSPYPLDGNGYIIGQIRVRQERVKSYEAGDGPCKIDDLFRPITSECAPDFSPATESTDDIPNFEYRSINLRQPVVSPAGFTFHDDGGYIWTAESRNLTVVLQELNNLETSNFIDSYTRIVFIEFFAYSGNLNLLTQVQLLMEYTSSGRMMPGNYIFSTRLYPFTNVLTIVVIGIACFLVLIEIFQLFMNIRSGGVKGFIGYFIDFFNLIDISFFTLFFGIVAVHSISLGWIKNIGFDFSTNTPISGDSLQSLLSLRRVESNLLSACFMLIWTMLIGFLKGFKSLGVLIIIIEKMIMEYFLRFLFVYMFISIGFAGAFLIIYTSSFEGFRAVGWSISSVIRMAIGDIPFDDISATNNRWGFVLLILYVGIGFILLLNLLIAMLNTAYSDVVAIANDIYYHSISQLATLYGANSVQLGKKELLEWETKNLDRRPRTETNST